MFKYNIIDKPNFDINKSVVDKIFDSISKLVTKKQNGTINIVFLDDDSIKNLNKKYRNIDKETDVLSFHYYDDFSELKDEETAGEVILSEKKVCIQAKEYGLGEEKEFYKLLIHSILHILGYDHEEDIEYQTMQELENEIFTKCIG